MNRILLLVTLVLFTFVVSAQDENKEEPKPRRVAIKFAPAGLEVGKITLGGEYNFSRRHSVTLVAGIPIDKTYPISYQGNTSNLTVNATSVMGGYRSYFGKRPMHGLYLESYLKYVKLQAKGPINGNIGSRTAVFDSQFDYSGFGMGAQLGVQFIIARIVVLDFYFLGPEINTAKFSSSSTDTYNSVPWSYVDAQQAQSDIKDKLNDIPVVGNKIDVTVDQNAKTVYTSYKGFTPGFRVGASLGIRF